MTRFETGLALIAIALITLVFALSNALLPVSQGGIDQPVQYDGSTYEYQR